jgi:outer membrane lipoprotein SlyB
MDMTEIHTWRRRKVLLCLAFAAPLAACAPSSTRLPPQAPPAAPVGQMTLGRIVAIRSITVAAGQGDAGLDAVLAAIGQPAANLPQRGEEFVIRQDDGNTVAVAQSNAAGFAVGDEVGIIAADQTTLIHR